MLLPSLPPDDVPFAPTALVVDGEALPVVVVVGMVEVGVVCMAETGVLE